MLLLESDVLRLFSRMPYAVLAKPDRAKSFLARMVRDARELQSILVRYPQVRYEPLDAHYVFIRCLGGLGEELIQDLCLHYSWRGVVWAAWLAALAPDARYRLPLLEARDRVPHNRWLVDLAIAEIDDVDWLPDPEMPALIRQLRAQLSKVVLPDTVFRRSPDAECLARMQLERERVRAAYRSGGLDAALAVLKESALLRGH